MVRYWNTMLERYVASFGKKPFTADDILERMWSGGVSTNGKPYKHIPTMSELTQALRLCKFIKRVGDKKVVSRTHTITLGVYVYTGARR